MCLKSTKKGVAARLFFTSQTIRGPCSQDKKELSEVHEYIVYLLHFLTGNTLCVVTACSQLQYLLLKEKNIK